MPHVPTFKSNYALMIKNLSFFDKMGFFLNPYKTGFIVNEMGYGVLGYTRFIQVIGYVIQIKDN